MRVGEEQQVNSIIYGDQFSPLVEALADGGWVVGWRTDQQVDGKAGTYRPNHDDISAQRYSAEGDPIGGEITINEHLRDFQFNPWVELLANVILVFSWISDGEVLQSIWKPTLAGTDAPDTLIGEENADHIFGEAGKDTFLGLVGDNDLWDGNGNGILNGGTGNDTLRGGADADTLVFSTGADRALGFGGGDRVDLSGVAAITSFADLQAVPRR